MSEPAAPLSPGACPGWLRPLLDNVATVREVVRRRFSPEMRAVLHPTNAKSRATGASRDAAVLVLFCGPDTDRDPAETLPDDADLLVTMRAAHLRHHPGQAAFPGGVSDDGDAGPVATALREAHEETGLDVSRVSPLAAMGTMLIPPSRFRVVPVLAYSADPGPIGVVDVAETAAVTRVPVRALVNPANRLMVYRDERSRRSAGPAFALNEMLIWGFTGEVISAMLDVAGWARPWDTVSVCGLHEAMALVDDGNGGGAGG